MIQIKRNKEVFLYLFWGVVTTIINIGLSWLLKVVFNIDVIISNTISWIITVLVAFLTNRVWVFNSPTKSTKEFFIQMFDFYTGRIVTLLIENAILFIFVDYLKYDFLLIKIIACVIVVILNYVFSKAIVFKKKTTKA